MNMSNTEETPKSNQKRCSSIDDFLEIERKKAKIHLSTTDDKRIEDLDYMYNVVQGLINIINEIWDNCKNHLTFNNNSPFTFLRSMYEKVKVVKNGRKLTITTKKNYARKDFRSPPALPEDLSKLVCFDPPESKSDILPDYDKYLKKSAILCKDVLLPFLIGFKEHLENVQVYLGQIETWLEEPKVIDSFLKNLFDDVGEGTWSEEVLFQSFCLDANSQMDCTFDLCTEVGREALEGALTLLKKFKPITQIVVESAGEKAVNGTYTIKGNSPFLHNRPEAWDVFTRSGEWDGKPTTFYLMHRKSEEGNDIKSWYLYCKYLDVVDGWKINERNNNFYMTESTGDEEYALPTVNRWKNASRGIDPAPTLRMKSFQQQQGPGFIKTIQIYVKTQTGKNITISVKNNDTVDFLKSKIQDHEGIPHDEQSLIYLGKDLDDTELTRFRCYRGDPKGGIILKHFEFQQESTIYQLPSPLSSTSAMKIFVKGLITGETKPYVVFSTDTIASLKTKILHWEGYIPYHQRLIFSGNELEEGRTFSDYDIQHESRIHIVIRYSGRYRYYERSSKEWSKF